MWSIYVEKVIGLCGQDNVARSAEADEPLLEWDLHAARFFLVASIRYEAL